MSSIKLQVFTPGGILGLEDLSKIINTCRLVDGKSMQFGHRQEVIAEIPEDQLDRFTRLLNDFTIQTEKDTVKRHNIVTSYLAQDITTTSFWTKEGIYYEILDQFAEVPRIRVNLTDLQQDFVYSFTGDINFVASEEVNYWNVYFRAKERGNLELFPYIIHTEDIAKFCELYEKLFLSGIGEYDMIVQALVAKFGAKALQSDIHPHIKVSEFYNYEGFHEYKGKFWLGIYMRETSFPIEKLDAIRQLARQQRIGNIYITPWKSIIIKDIHREFLTDWKFVLAQNKISIGHSSSELNWQLNDFDTEAHSLKAALRKEFSLKDISLIGVIFGINNIPSYSFSHIIIRQQNKQQANSLVPVSYDILYRKDFNPTINDFLVFKKRVPYDQLVPVLQEVIALYYKLSYHEFASFNPRPISLETLKKEEKEEIMMHQCSSCFTTYDPKFGEQQQGIEPGTSFSDLPETFVCPVCDAEKAEFKEIRYDQIDQIN